MLAIGFVAKAPAIEPATAAEVAVSLGLVFGGLALAVVIGLIRGRKARSMF